MKTKLKNHIRLTKLILFLFCIKFSYAQDTLYYKNGNYLIAKVTEITPNEIKYKTPAPENDEYSVNKNEFSSIKFENGYIEVMEYKDPEIVKKTDSVGKILYMHHNPVLSGEGPVYMYDNKMIGNKSLYNFLLSTRNKEISYHITEATSEKHWQYIGFAIIPCSIASIVYFAGMPTADSNENRRLGTLIGAIGVACFTTSITLKVKRNNHEKEAVRIYQENY